MVSEGSPHLAAFALHEKEALARGQGPQILQLEFDLPAFVRGFEE